MKSTGKTNGSKSRKKGVIGVVIMLMVLAIVTAATSFSFDYTHGVVARESLQNATDAGALAGAMELARDNLSSMNLTEAESFARQVVASNKVDGKPVSENVPGVKVEISINTTTSPRTVVVTATKEIDTMFARMFGWNLFPVSTRSIAAANRGIVQVKRNQLLPLAISLDHKPERGLQKDIPLQDILTPGQPFNIILNPKKEKNSTWLKNWTAAENLPITIGQDVLALNGAQAKHVSQLQPGDSFNVPLILGDPPFNDSRRIVGVIGFEVISVNFPLIIQGKIRDPIIIKGVPGTPVVGDLSHEGITFLSEHQPWQVSLSD